MTKLFTVMETEENNNPFWLDKYPQPIASIIDDYKKAFHYLQLTILESELNNREDIGLCFEELEWYFDKLLSNFNFAE